MIAAQDDGMTSPLSSSTKRHVTKSRVLSIVVLALLSIAYFGSIRFKNPRRLDVASLHLRDLDDRPIPPSLFAGKAIVINFWAPWCLPCQVETPWFIHQQQLHQSDLLFIGVVTDEGTYREARSFMIERGGNYPLAKANAALDDAVGGLAELPTTLYISRSGRVVHLVSGLASEDRVKAYVQDAIHSQ